MLLLRIYKVISFILLPIGLLLGAFSLVGLVLAIGNIAVLLPVCVSICTTIYIISNFLFVYNGLIKEKHCAMSLKDWIKVNAYVALFFSSSCIMQFVSLMLQPEILKNLLDQGMSTQKNVPANIAVLMPQIFMGVLYFLLAIGILLLTNIAFTLTFIKTKADVFEDE